MRRERITATAVLIVLQLCSTLPTIVTAEDEGEAPWQSYYQDDAKPLLPEAVPEPNGTIELMVDVPASRVVSYNMLTGEEMVLDMNLNQKDMPPEVWIPGSERAGPQILEDEFNLLNFSDLSWVAHPDVWPWSPHCKIYYTRHGIRYTGSGVLIDAYHVLCAGHTVHEGNGGIWSSDVVVVPAYHGGIRPYGDAKGVFGRSWEAWTLNGDQKHDIGIIRLDRPVGALTGWYGCGRTSDRSFYLRTPFHNPGYPAELPYSGQYMYYWGGTFDNMDYPSLMINRRCVAGQDGSGAYWIDSAGHRYVYAVLSSRNNSQTFFPMITEGKLQDIRSTINEVTPSRFDLLGLGVRVSPGVVWAGDQLDSMSYVAYNHSSASQSGRVYVNVYLSTNNYISTSDTFLDRHYFNLGFGAKQIGNIMVTNPPTIPSDIASGEYWIGVKLDISDNDMSNNYSHGQEAARIVVRR